MRIMRNNYNSARIINNSDITIALVSESKALVGSSASKIGGDVIIALARATL